MKFRIYNNQLKKYITPDEWFISGNGEVFYNDMMDGELVKCDNCIVQRFTELYDKENNPIYEGDILINSNKETKSNVYEKIVEYKFGKWILNDMEDIDDYWIDNTEVGDIINLKIVGNIIENKKL